MFVFLMKEEIRLHKTSIICNKRMGSDSRTTKLFVSVSQCST